MRRARTGILLIFLAALFLAQICFVSTATAGSLEEETIPVEEPGERDLDLRFMEEAWQEIEGDVEEYFPSFHWRHIVDWIRGEEDPPEIKELFQGLSRLFLGEVLLNLRFMGKLLVLAVAAAFLKNLQGSFESKSVSWLTRGVVFLSMIGIILPGFTGAIDMARQTITGMVDFILALVPLLLVLLSSLGSLSAASLFHPLLIFSVHFFSTVINNVIFPLILFSVALSLVSHFSPELRLGKLADFFKDLCVWGLGLLLTLFMGIVSIQGVAGTVMDAVTLRTAKFLTGTFVPVVGKMLADSVETVASGSLLLKNGAGIAGLIVLGMSIVFPFIKLFVLMLVYKATAALVQIVGEGALGDCLNTMGNCYTLVLASLVAVSLMFFLAVVIIVGSGNALVMLR